MSTSRRPEPELLRVLAWPSTRVLPNGQENDPYPRLLYTGLARRGVEVANFGVVRLLAQRWHIWHMHWPDGIVAGNRSSLVLLIRIVVFWLLLKLTRIRGTRIVWTAHNAKPHELCHPLLVRWFFDILTGNLAAVICLSRSGELIIREQYPKVRRLPIYIVPHGHYWGCYPDNVSRQEARQRLQLGAHELVLLFIGQLRRYKNVIRLIECFRAAVIPDWRLVIAGDPRDAALAKEIVELASPCSQITPILAFVPNDELQVFLRASDLVVLPYADILNSGAALLALSFGRPVLVPARGALVDLKEEIGDEWVMTYENDLAPETLRSAVAWVQERPRPEDAPLEPLEWEPIRDLTADIFREVVSAGPRPLPRGQRPVGRHAAD